MSIDINDLWKKGNCYADSKYYNSLLPHYSFQGLTDLSYLNQYLSKNLRKKTQYALEFAAGSGRASDILRKYIDCLTVVEINQAFLNRFAYEGNARLIKEDMNVFAKKEDVKNYDLIFSFWGPYLKEDSAQSLIENMSAGTIGLFFHAHRGFEEQRMIRRILHKFKDAKYNPNCDKSEKEEKFTATIDKFRKRGIIDFSIEEIEGVSKFHDLESAIESFANFHLGGVFNQDKYFQVCKFLENALEEYHQENKSIELTSGMKLFRIDKL